MADQSTVSLPGLAVVTLVPSWLSSPGGGVEPAWGLLVLSTWIASCRWFQAEVACEGKKMKDKCPSQDALTAGWVHSPLPAPQLLSQRRTELHRTKLRAHPAHSAVSVALQAEAGGALSLQVSVIWCTSAWYAVYWLVCSKNVTQGESSWPG